MKKFYKLILIIILFIQMNAICDAQKFADKKYFLVDSLILENLSVEDKKLIDSALNIYHHAKNDTSRIHAIIKIIDKSWDENVWPRYNRWMYEESKKCLKKKINAQIEKRLNIFISSALNNFGVIALNKGKIDESLKYLHESLEIERKYSGERNIATSLSNIAYIYNNQGDIPKALEYYHKGLAIQEKYHDSIGIARSLNNIGFIYQNLGDSTKALEYYHQSLSIRQKINDKMGIAVSLSNIAEIYDEGGNYKKAIEFYKKGNELYKSIGNQQGLAKGLNNIGFIYIMRGDPFCKDSKEKCFSDGIEIALDYCTKSLEIQIATEDKFGMTSSLNNLSRIHLLKNNTPLAKQHAEKAYDMSKELGFPENIKKASSLLKEISFRNGNYKEAYEYFLEETLMRDSLEKKDNYKLAQQKQAKYFYDKIHVSDSVAFAEQKKIRDEKQKAELKIKENERLYLYIGVSLLIIFIGFLFNRFRIIQKQKKIIEHQKLLVEEKNKEVLDSIKYAKGIQDAILPSSESLNKYLKNGFVLYIPKDIVAGDFYWMEQNEQFIFVAVADCTGHGVPGAMVSVICSSALNRAVKEFNLTDPGEILDKVREIVIDTFSKSENEVYDGMDISLCCFHHLDSEMHFTNEKTDKNHSKLYWAGANNPLWIIRNGEVLNFSPDKQPIGKYFELQPFITHVIEIKKDDTLYLFSDGYADQFGGLKGKKFKYSNLQKLLLKNVNLNPEIQKSKLLSNFHEWRGDLEQVDDVCIIGIKI